MPADSFCTVARPITVTSPAEAPPQGLRGAPNVRDVSRTMDRSSIAIVRASRPSSCRSDIRSATRHGEGRWPSRGVVTAVETGRCEKESGGADARAPATPCAGPRSPGRGPPAFAMPCSKRAPVVSANFAAWEASRPSPPATRGEASAGDRRTLQPDGHRPSQPGVKPRRGIAVRSTTVAWGPAIARRFLSHRRSPNHRHAPRLGFTAKGYEGLRGFAMSHGPRPFEHRMRRCGPGTRRQREFRGVRGLTAIAPRNPG